MNALDGHRVVAVFDADDAGAQAREWWHGALQNAQTVTPPAHDVSDYWKDGGDLRKWVEALI